MKQKSLGKNYLYSVAYQILLLIMPLITTPYVSRILEADGIGAYSYSFSIITYFGMIGVMGTSVYGQLQVSTVRDDKQKLSTVVKELLLTRLILIGLTIICYVIFAFANSTNRTIYLVLLPYLFSLLFDVSWVLQGMEMFKETVLKNSIVKIVTTMLVFVFVKEKTHLYRYVLLIQVSALITSVSMWSNLKSILQEKVEVKLNLKRNLKGSLVYFVPTIATSVYTVLDKSMLGWILKSSYENGYYEQAHKIEQMLLAIITSLGVVTLPRISYMHNNGYESEIKPLVTSTLNFISCISLPMCAGVFLLADEIVYWLLGDGYEPCVSLLRIFVFLIVIIGFDNTIGKQCIMSVGKQRQFNISVIIGAITNLVLNLILIPILKSTGAAIASVSAETIILIMFICWGKEYLEYRKILINFLRYLGFTMVMSVVVAVCKRMLRVSLVGFAIEVIVGVCTYTILLIITRDSMLTTIKDYLRKLRSHT